MSKKEELMMQILQGVNAHLLAKYDLKLEEHELRNVLFPASQRFLQEDVVNTVGPSNVIDFMQFLEKRLYGHILDEVKGEEKKPAEVLELKKSTSQKKKKDV